MMLYFPNWNVLRMRKAFWLIVFRIVCSLVINAAALLLPGKVGPQHCRASLFELGSWQKSWNGNLVTQAERSQTARKMFTFGKRILMICKYSQFARRKKARTDFSLLPRSNIYELNLSLRGNLQTLCVYACDRLKTRRLEAAEDSRRHFYLIGKALPSQSPQLSKLKMDCDSRAQFELWELRKFFCLMFAHQGLLFDGSFPAESLREFLNL